MPTRIYLPGSGASAVTPTPDAAWTVVGASSLVAVTTKTPTASNDFTANSLGAGNENVLCLQYVIGPLSAQTIDGTVRGQIWCRESLAAMNAMSQLVLRVVSSDGTVVRGTLLAAHAEALSSEWGAGAAARSRKFPLAALSPATLTPVAAQGGDLLVIEIGALVTAAAVGEVRVRVHDNLASDLPEDETTNDTADPWIEFSADLWPVSRGGSSIGAGVSVEL